MQNQEKLLVLFYLQMKFQDWFYLPYGALLDREGRVCFKSGQNAIKTDRSSLINQSVGYLTEKEVRAHAAQWST